MKDWIDQNHITEIECIAPDLAGAAREVLSDTFIDVYAAVKEVEFDNFLNVISPWEREHLLLKV
jgi:glutamine synthetase